MRDTEKINNTVEFVKSTLEGAEWGHDWWHIYRVWNNAKKILNHEPNANRLIVELWALLHDIADAKFHNWDEEKWPELAIDFLTSLNIDIKIIDQVEYIIRNISFKNSLDWNIQEKTLELQIVQDADRLDALWAIGIARCFNFWGYKWRELYNPSILPKLRQSKEEYKKSLWTTLNHFYEKLFLLKEKMNTTTGKKLALERHVYMENFVKQFLHEWN